VADLDGDGAPDLVWLARKGGAIEAWRMSGATPVAAFSLPNAPAKGAPAGSGDLDGDGDDDLVWRARHGKTRTLDVWFVDGMNAPAQGIAVAGGKKALVRGIVDVTSDGQAEIVLVTKQGFSAVSVDPTGSQNASGDMQWNTQTQSLSEVPASKRWNFLVLE
jgi:hypothetical protein